MAKRFLMFFFSAVLLAACANASTPTPEQSPAQAAPGSIVAPESKSLDTGSAGLPEVGQPAPDFEYTLADGTTTKLSDLRGKKVIVNFWASWCDPCREEMPDLDKVRKEYGDNLIVLAVNKAEKIGQINRFTNQVPVGFTLITNSPGDIAERYRTATVPNTYFINSDGTIGARELVVLDYTTMKQNIDALR